MKVGMFMMPLHPPEKSRTQGFDEDIEVVIQAEEMGFNEVWVGQHHTLAWEPLPSNDIFIASVIPRTSKIRLGPGVTIMPQHHPANVAVRLAMLDHLCRGRLLCGFGQGGVPTDWELFDLPDGKTQGLMTVEAIDMVLKLWQATAPFDFQGQYYRIRIQNPIPELGMGELLRPYQQPHPPIAMSIMRGQSLAATMSGERGYLPLSTNLVPVSTVAEHWQTYCAGAAAAGRPNPDRSIWRVSRSIYVGESNEEAWEHCLNGTFGRSLDYLITILRQAKSLHLVKHDPGVSDDEVTPAYMMKHLCIIGDRESVTAQLRRLYDATGGFGTLLMIAHDWDDKGKWLRSMQRLADEVVPALP